MNKEQEINKIVKDLPIKELRSKMSDVEWYGWFEECWNEAINYTRCSTELKEKYAPDFVDFLNNHCKEVKKDSCFLYKGNEWSVDALHFKYVKRIKPNL